jgi:hypothetical protein
LAGRFEQILEFAAKRLELRNRLFKGAHTFPFAPQQ